MLVFKVRSVLWTSLLGLALVGTAACAPAAAQQGTGSVSVLGSWKGAEQDAFVAMVAPFERRTGIRVEYRSTDNLSARLWKSVATGDPPDIAGLPGPGEMRELARMGALVSLGGVLDVAAYKSATAPAFVELGTVDDELAGVFVKGTVKGLIWYNPKVFTLDPPTTWDELKRSGRVSARSSARTWCMGLEAGDASGWPATDWIEDIVLRQSGPKTYDDWVAGRLKWNSPAVHQAFETFGDVIDPGATAGGAATAIATNFADAGNPLFADQAGCLFLHQASFIPPFFKRRAGARDGEFDFFSFPAMNSRFSNSLIVAGDLLGMFHDTPESRALMNYLVSDEAQAIRVQSGGALSVNSHVTDYPDDIARREAALLQNAEHVRFDASDLMPDALNKAFLQASIDFARDPSRLDDLLNNLDQVAAGNVRPHE